MKFKEIHKSQWPKSEGEPPERVYRNDDFLVQVKKDNGFTRLTINRVKYDTPYHGFPVLEGRIGWDELQDIKDSIGYIDQWAVECYPPYDEIVNVANMRHLWILPSKPEFGWSKR